MIRSHFVVQLIAILFIKEPRLYKEPDNQCRHDLSTGKLRRRQRLSSRTSLQTVPNASPIQRAREFTGLHFLHQYLDNVTQLTHSHTLFNSSNRVGKRMTSSQTVIFVVDTYDHSNPHNSC